MYVYTYIYIHIYIYIYGGFLKWGLPRIIHFQTGFSIRNHLLGGATMTMELPIYTMTMILYDNLFEERNIFPESVDNGRPL